MSGIGTGEDAVGPGVGCEADRPVPLRVGGATSIETLPAAKRSHDPCVSLCDALDRILSKGVVARGDLVISVAGVDLIYVGVGALVASVDAVQRGVGPVARAEPSDAGGL